MREFSGDPNKGKGSGCYAIVAGKFNRRITDQLVAGAEQALIDHGVASENIDCVWVPGAFEIPLMCKRLTEVRTKIGRKYTAIIALGAVIRGETPHFDYVAGECARGIAKLNLTTGIPISFGVLTTDTVEQAERRADCHAKDATGNKGAAAAIAALEMVNLLHQTRTG